MKSHYGHMVHEYYVEKLRAIMRDRSERISALQTRSDAEKYVRYVRKKVKQSFGPLPKRTSLNAVVTGCESFPHYDLEKVVFESRPGFLVTGNLYLPTSPDLQSKRPAVLGLCGHASDGKANAHYQSFCQGLAAKGFVVFIIDPIAQGERRQFFSADGIPHPPLCVTHNLIGNQMVLCDDFFGTWRVWDAIRGLDYLLSRQEVDRKHVGVTGNSGGGTLTSYLSALDPRLTMAAPSCYICSWLSNMQNELPSDAEQNIPRVLAAGLDEVDLLLCHAPRPTIILSQRHDFFDERYAQQAHTDMRRVHELLGSKNTAEYFAGPHGHGYHIENREAMYGFFLKQTGLPGDNRERHVSPVDQKLLNVVPWGNTKRSGSLRVFDFTSKRALALTEQRRAEPKDEKTICKAAARLLGIPQTKMSPPAYRALGYSFETDLLGIKGVFAIEPEPRIQTIVTTFWQSESFMHPPTGCVTLYVGHTTGLDDVRQIKEIRLLAAGKQPFAVVDPRGTGTTMAETCRCNDFFHPYGSDYLYAVTGEMLGESYLGRRVFDVLRTIDFLLDNGAEEVRLMGRGIGSVTAIFAALLHPSKPRVKLINYLPSYELIATSPYYKWPLSSLLRGCLPHFDLPDIYRAMNHRLIKSKPWNANMKLSS